jgi:hypothetical protein
MGAAVLLFGHFGGPFVKQNILVLITAAFARLGLVENIGFLALKLIWGDDVTA